MEESQLKMNDAKTEFIVLGTANNLWKNTLGNIEIGNTKIHWSSNIKFLGVLLDEKLASKTTFKTDQKKPTTTSGSLVTFINTLISTLPKCYSAPWY